MAKTLLVAKLETKAPPQNSGPKRLLEPTEAAPKTEEWRPGIRKRDADPLAALGDASIGVQTQHSEKVPVAVSAILLLGGAGMMIAGRKS